MLRREKGRGEGRSYIARMKMMKKTRKRNKGRVNAKSEASIVLEGVGGPILVTRVRSIVVGQIGTGTGTGAGTGSFNRCILLTLENVAVRSLTLWILTQVRVMTPEV